MLLEYIAIAVMIVVATLIAAIAIGLGELLGAEEKNRRSKKSRTNRASSPSGRERGACRSAST